MRENEKLVGDDHAAFLWCAMTIKPVNLGVQREREKKKGGHACEGGLDLRTLAGRIDIGFHGNERQPPPRPRAFKRQSFANLLPTFALNHFLFYRGLSIMHVRCRARSLTTQSDPFCYCQFFTSIPLPTLVSSLPVHNLDLRSPIYMLSHVSAMNQLTNKLIHYKSFPISLSQ